MMVRRPRTGTETDRSVELQQKLTRLEEEGRALRETLGAIREKLRQQQSTLQALTRRLNPHVTQLKQTVNQSKDLGARFLKSELALGRLFLEIAVHTSDSEKRDRNLQNARIAFQTLTRYRRQTLLTRKAAKEFDRKVAQLREMFKRSGESL